MTNHESVVPDTMRIVSERFGYAPAVKAGPFLLMAGQLGRDDDLNVIEDKQAQVVQAFENVKTVLAAAGLTFDDVVEIVTYHTDLSDLPLVMEVKGRYVTDRDRLPAWTALGVTALAMPGLFVEVKCTALLRDT
ncbi:RutC family protein YjgH [Baekduia alba]|uniref:RidA family protein n=1 Tax=Baekduia alba TaxID=2997333 RepID=UPI0023402980|nr:RidA family protein [Baekduia alba]WCB94870.1 RutC family protein YjgH [Baekduia alba]